MKALCEYAKYELQTPKSIPQGAISYARSFSFLSMRDCSMVEDLSLETEVALEA
jgi:hypothetical protein